VCRRICATVSLFASAPVREGETEERRELAVRVRNRKASKPCGEEGAINRRRGSNRHKLRYAGTSGTQHTALMLQVAWGSWVPPKALSPSFERWPLSERASETYDTGNIRHRRHPARRRSAEVPRTHISETAKTATSWHMIAPS